MIPMNERDRNLLTCSEEAVNQSPSPQRGEDRGEGEISPRDRLSPAPIHRWSAKTLNKKLTVCAALAALVPLSCQQRAAPQARSEPPTIKSASGVELVSIPAGSFAMGARSGRDEEKPVHRVSVDAFLIDRHEVTQAEFEKLGKIEAFPNPSHFKGADLPVEQVTWPQAARFCNARSRLEGLEPCYNDDTGACNFAANGYRLPTEAEWEYACRARSEHDYSFGDDPRQLGDFAWFADNSAKKTHPVGTKKPNPWGLHDMHGNVAEWCQDVYDPTYYRSSPPENPCGPADGNEYVLRGGSWKSPADALPSSRRLGENPGFSDACLARDAIGFRCVRKPSAAKNGG
jgi:formylglycine-generating enzyme required for sulfatase activity